MKPRVILIVIVIMIMSSCFLMWLAWVKDAPRRASVEALFHFNTELSNSNGSRLLDAIVMPRAVADRTAAEQTQFILKALRDEISTEGLIALKSRGQFGPLLEVFPTEGSEWAKLADVSAEQCVAFRLEANGQRAEVVLLKEIKPGNKPGSVLENYRLVRCNNVKQMALATP